MGGGSQRAGLAAAARGGTCGVARERAPHALLIANIGAPQLIAQHGKPPFTVADARRAVEMIGAGALAVHLNFLQEAAQPEGDRNARGCLAALRTLTGAGGVPGIGKETGAGVSFEQARALAAVGVSAIDVGGAGGSSMAAMESHRAASRGDARTAGIGQLFREWGIATPIAVVEAAQGAPALPLIATGRVRSGLDAARALALGARLVGMGFPFPKAASQGVEALRAFLEPFLTRINVALQLSGASTIPALAGVPAVVTGATREWLQLPRVCEVLRSLARRGM